MGVNGLWKLLEPSGKAVPVETLENKVLAVDVSIWLHQVTKGFQDAGGNPLPNAHLLGLFHRLCKLLFYKIKPVFVFDGGVPHLKKQTVAARRQLKSKAEVNAERVREQLLKNILKHKAVKRVLGDKAGPSEVGMSTGRHEDDMFQLPVTPTKQDELSTDEEHGSVSEDSPHKHLVHDLHSLDVNSAHFKSLPADVRRDILSELKETRKQNSWGRLHEMPEESGKFSNYQMNRLLKRRSVQVSLEEAEKEMGGKTFSLGELEDLLNEHGVLVDSELQLGKRIASDNATRYIFINGKREEAVENKIHNTEKVDSSSLAAVNEIKVDNKDNEESELFKREIDDHIFETLNMTEEGNELVPVIVNENASEQTSTISDRLRMARNFMFENSGLTQEQILMIIKNQTSPEKNKKAKASFTAIPSTSSENIENEVSVINQVSVACSPAGTVDADIFVKRNPILRLEENTAVEIVKTKDNSDVDKETANAAELPKEEGSSDPKAESGSESDIGFVEVEDIPSSILSWEKVKPPILEVLIEPNKCDMEEDIFADVFKNGNKEESVEIKSDQSSFTNNIQHENKYSVDNQHEPLSDVICVEKEKEVKQSDVICVEKEKEVKQSDVICVEKEKEVKQVELSSNVSDTTLTKPEVIAGMENPNKVKEGLTAMSHELNVLEDVPQTVELLPEQVTQNRMTDDQLHNLQASLENEHHLLLSEKSKQDRLAASITDQMYMEAQELLQLFGVPYIIAPMEAEAQCAFLDAISLTDGTITDDSDIWLFGGQKVYKNFFNQKKHVMQFRAVDILHYFKLTRHQMVLLALLVGSDYTAGLQGVGPVTALEILAAFPSTLSEADVELEANGVVQSLQNFRAWWVSGRSVGPGKTSLRSKLKDLRLHEGFPSIAVIDAYLKPSIDQSKEKFSWNTPDLASLRIYAREKFGWSKNKIDEILLPVIKKLGEKNSQQSLDSYFQAKPKLPVPEGKLSKRVQHAVQKLGTGQDEQESSSDSEVLPLKRRKQGPVVQRGRGRGRRGEAGAAACNGESGPSTSGEFILQREKDKLNALNNRLKAIEVFRTSKTGLDRTKRQKRAKRQELLEAKLSESSSSE